MRLHVRGKKALADDTPEICGHLGSRDGLPCLGPGSHGYYAPGLWYSPIQGSLDLLGQIGPLLLSSPQQGLTGPMAEGYVGFLPTKKPRTFGA